MYFDGSNVSPLFANKVESIVQSHKNTLSTFSSKQVILFTSASDGK